MTPYEFITKVQEVWAEAENGELYIVTQDAYGNSVIQEIEDVWIDIAGDICIGRKEPT